jgi:hypothetical protein
MDSAERFVEELVGNLPELQGIYMEHVDDYGILLPHVFMGDVTRFAVELALSTSGAQALRVLLAQMEEAFLSDEILLVNLVTVSFVENLAGETKAVELLIPMMGEMTRRQLRPLFED